MLKISAYPAPQAPSGASASPVAPGTPGTPGTGSGSPSYQTPVPKPPGMWDAFKGGLDSVNKYKKPGLSSQEWADYKLTRQQWLDKYPDKTWQDYGNWYQSVQKRRKQQTNWFQRATWPLHRFIPRQ